MLNMDGVADTGTVMSESPSDDAPWGNRGCLCCTLSSGDGMIVHTHDVFTNDSIGTSKSAVDLVGGLLRRGRYESSSLPCVLLLVDDVLADELMLLLLLLLLLDDVLEDVATAAHVDRCCERRSERLLNMGDGVVLSSSRSVIGSFDHKNLICLELLLRD